MNAEIIADTSLYSNLSDRLRALALVMEAPSAHHEYLCHVWSQSAASLPSMVMGLIGGTEYRIRPEPARLWFQLDSDRELFRDSFGNYSVSTSPPMEFEYMKWIAYIREETP